MREDKPARPVSAEDLSLQITPVAVPIPQFTRDGKRHPNKEVLGFQVTGGVADISHLPAIEGLQKEDRIIIYVRTDKEILRIESDGTVRRLSFRTGETETIGRLEGLGSSVAVRVGENASIPCNIASEGNMPGHLPAVYIENYTVGPVREVLIRTSRMPPAEMQEAPTTDTALIMGDPRGFTFSPGLSPVPIGPPSNV